MVSHPSVEEHLGCFQFLAIINKCIIGTPGWLTQLSVRPQLEPHSSWVWALHWAWCWQLSGACFRFCVYLSLCPSPCPPLVLCPSLSKINKHTKNKFVINLLVYVLWTFFLPFPQSLPPIFCLWNKYSGEESTRFGEHFTSLCYLKNIGYYIDYLLALFYFAKLDWL